MQEALKGTGLERDIPGTHPLEVIEGIVLLQYKIAIHKKPLYAEKVHAHILSLDNQFFRQDLLHFDRYQTINIYVMRQ